MSDIGITISGGQEVIDRLNKLGRLDFGNEFDEIAGTLENYYANEVFFSQGGVYGARWPALQRDTVIQKQKLGGLAGSSAAAPLIRSGLMQRSFKHTASGNSIRVFNTQDYFQYHQLGTRNIPQRLMISFNSSLKTQIKNIIEDGIKKRLA